jgi:hypothetical protein
MGLFPKILQAPSRRRSASPYRTEAAGVHDAFFVSSRELLVALAARHGLPTIYFSPLFVASGGLISYGPNIADAYRQALAAVYVALFWISMFNMALAFVMFNRSLGLFALGTSLIFPFYQGVYMKFARFFSYSSEILFATSQRDDFVPPRVRSTLFGNRI